MRPSPVGTIIVCVVESTASPSGSPAVTPGNEVTFPSESPTVTNAFGPLNWKKSLVPRTATPLPLSAPNAVTYGNWYCRIAGSTSTGDPNVPAPTFDVKTRYAPVGPFLP